MTSGRVVVVPSYDAKANLEAIIAPTVNNDETEGYEPGSFWIDTVAAQAYVCVDATTGAANWKTFGGIPAGGLLYKGAWNANTNDPTLGDNGAGGIKGDYYVVSVAGTTSIDGISDWQVLDWIVNNGTIWEKVDNTQAAHDMGGSFHIADTLANLNTKVSDATLVPAAHGHTGGDDGVILNQIGPLNTTAFGTVTIAAGTPDVVGVGTFFEYEYVDGVIKIAGKFHVILSIVDQTHLTLATNHIAGASGAPYYTENRHVVHGTDANRDSPVDTWDNVSIGYKALGRSTGYGYQVAVGADALGSNINGVGNCAIGWRVMRKNVDGNRNTALGFESLANNISGEENVAVGHKALSGNRGSYNTAIGRQALDPSITGDRNVAIGYKAGYNETGSDKLYIANGPDPADTLIYGDFATRMLGLGTVSPTAVLHLKGVLTDVLTGTVSVTIGTAAVVGVGTAFDTELALGDAIKIADEIFTVQAITDALNLTLDSNHAVGASGVAAYRDPDLFKIQTGDGSDRVVVTKSGFVYLTSDVYFANTTHYLGSMIPGSNIKIYASTAVGSIQLRNTIQTPDAPMLLTGALANHWIICEHADEGVDFGHAQQVNPTVFIQSADATDVAQWLSLTHNQTSGVIATGAGNLQLLPVAGSITQIGTGSKTFVGANEDLLVSGKFEVVGQSYYLDILRSYANIELSDNKLVKCGSDFTIQRSTAHTPPTAVLGVPTASRALVICEDADKGINLGHAQQTNPTVFIHSADATDTAQWVSQAHDQTDGVAESGKGDYLIKTPAQKTLKLGTVVWDDLPVPLVGVQAGGLKPPAWAQFKDDGSSSVGVYAWAFADEAVAANEQQLFFAKQLPHGYKEGSDVLVHIHWSPAVGGAADEFVKWGCEYTWINIDGTFGNTAIITSDASAAATATTSGDGTMVADKHYKTKIGTIAGSGKEISSMLICRVFRNSSDSDDDLAQDAFGLEIDFHHQIDTMGSRQELVK